MGIGDWNIQRGARRVRWVRHPFDDKSNGLVSGYFNSAAWEIAHANARSLEILNNGNRDVMPYGGFADRLNSSRVGFVGAMGKIQARRVHAAENQAVKKFGRFTGRAYGADDFCVSHSGVTSQKRGRHSNKGMRWPQWKGAFYYW